MGCDIHLMVQTLGHDGHWHEVPPDPAFVNDEWCLRYRHWWGDRSYVTFSVLADVRNDHDIIPVVTPLRGLPEGVTNDDEEEYEPATPPLLASLYDVGALTIGQVEKLMGGDGDIRVRGFWFGDHSFHWLTLQELVDYPRWDSTYTASGLVNAREYLERFYGRPREVDLNPSGWCAMHCGPGVQNLTEAEFEGELLRNRFEFVNRIANDEPGMAAKISVRMEWERTLRHATSGFQEGCMRPLMNWATREGIPFDKIRLVFGFDN